MKFCVCLFYCIVLCIFSDGLDLTVSDLDLIAVKMCFSIDLYSVSYLLWIYVSVGISSYICDTGGACSCWLSGSALYIVGFMSA